jgi:ribonuclease-3
VSYRINASGPDHLREFIAVVVVMDTPYGSGTGRTKKEAEQKAAEKAVEALTQLDGAVPGEPTG